MHVEPKCVTLCFCFQEISYHLSFDSFKLIKIIKQILIIKKRKKRTCLRSQAHLETNPKVWRGPSGQGGTILPKEGEEEGNQMMMGVLWQVATARGRHHRFGRREEEEVEEEEGGSGGGGGGLRGEQQQDREGVQLMSHYAHHLGNNKEAWKEGIGNQRYNRAEINQIFYCCYWSVSCLDISTVWKCWKMSVSVSQKPKTTSSDVLFCQQPKNIKFTVKAVQRNHKVFTF